MKAFVRNKKLNVFTLNICSTSCGDYYQTSFIWYVLKAFFSPFPPSSFFPSLPHPTPPQPPFKIQCISCMGWLAKPFFKHWPLFFSMILTQCSFAEQFASASLWIQNCMSWKRASRTLLLSVVCRGHHLSAMKGTFLIAECWYETLTFISSPKGKGFIWVSKHQAPISFATTCLKAHFNSWWFPWKISLACTSIKQIPSSLRILTPFWTLPEKK